MLPKGKTYSEISASPGCSESTVSRHAQKLENYPRKGLFGPRPTYDRAAIRRHLEEGHSYEECKARFGFSKSGRDLAVKRGEVPARERRRLGYEQLQRRRDTKQRLVEDRGLEHGCNSCGSEDRMGEPLTLHLHHRNGNRDGHDPANLEFLCPNCHSQTDTYGSRNEGRILVAVPEVESDRVQIQAG